MHPYSLLRVLALNQRNLESAVVWQYGPWWMRDGPMRMNSFPKRDVRRHSSSPRKEAPTAESLASGGYDSRNLGVVLETLVTQCGAMRVEIEVAENTFEVESD